MSIEKVKNQIIAALSSPVLPGGVRTYSNVCGKKNCRCKDPINPKLHGPYRQLSYSISGKSSTLHLSEKEVPAASDAVVNFKKIKSLVNTLALEYALIVKNEDALSLQDNAPKFQKENPTKLTDNNKSEKLRQSRDKWRDRALESRAKLDKCKVQIRDLKASRENWRAKALQRGQENNKIKKQLMQMQKEETLKKSI